MLVVLFSNASMDSAHLIWPLVGNIANWDCNFGILQFPEHPGEKSCFEFSYGVPIWEYLRQNAEAKAIFDDFFHMREYGLKQDWFEAFSAKERLEEWEHTIGTGDKKPLIVDVGGGSGPDLKRFISAYSPRFEEDSFILEDLPETVQNVEGLPSCVEKRAYNFFTMEQPVKGQFRYKYS